MNDDADQLPTARLLDGERWVYNEMTGRRRRLRRGEMVRDGEAIRTRFMMCDGAAIGAPTTAAARRIAVIDALGADKVAGKPDEFVDGAYRVLFPDRAAQPASAPAVPKAEAQRGIDAALRDLAISRGERPLADDAETIADAERAATKALWLDGKTPFYVPGLKTSAHDWMIRRQNMESQGRLD